ncbi:MAG: GreA/GreB family elongation factor [Chloroflexota bacterium]
MVERGGRGSTAQPGSVVTVRHEDGSEETLTLVGPLEADISRGYISGESPAGQALPGKAAGAKVTAGTAADAVTLTVARIGKPDAATAALGGG